MSEAYYWLRVGHKLVEIVRCPSCGEAMQQQGPCDVCFQAVWLEWLARKVLIEGRLMRRGELLKDEGETQASE